MPVYAYFLLMAPRIERLHKLYRYFREKEMQVHASVKSVAFVKLFIVVFGFAHYIGCMFLFVARFNNFSDDPDQLSWI